MLSVYALSPKQDAISNSFISFVVWIGLWKLKKYEQAKTSKYGLTSLHY